MNIATLTAPKWEQKNWLLHHRWAWHGIFWIGYIFFRFWPYYLTLKFSPPVFLEYMLLSEVLFVGVTYFTLFLYRRLFHVEKYMLYFLFGTMAWGLYLYGRTLFQQYYLRNVKDFNLDISGVILSNITIVILLFLFITACKYFKNGYITRHLEAEKKKQQLVAEVNNLKSQIAPHFLFNTLNNLYGLAVNKSDKLPDLMLRLSDLLRHSLYETQKKYVPVNDEIDSLKSYVQLETIRLEDDLQLQFENTVPSDSTLQIAPLILIVFVENAFKHARLVRSEPVMIRLQTSLDDDWFNLTIKNNYNSEKEESATGIGLINVKRRLEVLYPGEQHELRIQKDESFYTVYLRINLSKTY